ncbi:hypothetical protein Tco_0640623, partial [Tanacetum coccineum]
MDMNSLIHSVDSSDEGKTSSSGSDSSRSSVNSGHEMVSGRAYGVVLRWFRIVRNYGSWEDHRYSEVLKGLGRGYGDVAEMVQAEEMVDGEVVEMVM